MICFTCFDIINPHMHKIFLQLYYMNWVPRDQQKVMLNESDKMTFLSYKSKQCTIYHGKHLSVTVWFRKFICFFKKRHHIAKTAWHWVPRDPSSIFSVATFTRKCEEAQIPCIPPISCQEIYDIIILTEVDRIHKKL